MKKVFSLLIVMAFVFSAVAQDANAEKNKKVKEPEITFETLTHDYGNIMQGDNGTCEFVFKNTGKADLLLTNCRSSCGCTVPEWPKDPIAPGKKATIKVKYNTQRIGAINIKSPCRKIRTKTPNRLKKSKKQWKPMKRA